MCDGYKMPKRCSAIKCMYFPMQKKRKRFLEIFFLIVKNWKVLSLNWTGMFCLSNFIPFDRIGGKWIAGGNEL